MDKRLNKTWEVSAYDKQNQEWTTALNHSWEHIPGIDDIRELLVREAPPTRITPSRRKIPTRKDSLTLVAGDAQIPFQDDTAMELFQTAVRELQPDNIVLVGDMVDLPNLSRFKQRPEWLGTTQQSIDQYHSFLAQTRSNSPNSRLAVVHGNHEQRFDNYIQTNAMELLGLRRANAGKELAILTLQHLVRYDELEVESIDGYPGGTLYLEDNLKVTHGTNTQKGGSNAAKYLREHRESVVYGHAHRSELAFRTWGSRLGGITIAAASPGCLARVDGTVPGYNHTINAQGEVVNYNEDWQQGLLLIEHNEKLHDITPVRFHENTMMVYGKQYEV